MPDASPTPIAYASVANPSGPRRQLSLFDSVCIIVGVIIGAGIFRVGDDVIGAAGGRAGLTALFWLSGGVISLLGALCYAELTTAYPKDGGEYVFLSRAFGPRVGFLFAWTGFWIVRPGNVGAMAYVFADYAVQVAPWRFPQIAWASPLVLAIGAVVTLTVTNAVGVSVGRWTQNVLTLMKVAGVTLVIGVAILQAGPPRVAPPPLSSAAFDYRLALIMVLFTYGGWNEIAYVAAEVREPRRQFVRCLVGGVLAVTTIYITFGEAQRWFHAKALTPPAEWTAGFQRYNPGDGASFLAVLICLSSLGAVQGMIFAGSRIYYAVGADQPAYRWLGRWGGAKHGGSPVRSLLLQGAVTLALVIAFGLQPGSFEAMVVFTTPVFYFFFLLAAVSLFVLRRRDRHVERPFKVPLYPLTPILFAASCAFMLWSSLTYAWDNRRWEALWSIALTLAGVIVSLLTTRKPPQPVDGEALNGERARV